MINNGLLSAYAANGVDQLLWYGAHSILASPNFAIARVISMVVFPILASIDCAYQIVCYLYEKALVWVITNAASSNNHQNHCQWHWDQINRLALAIIASPFSLISPDIVTHHFVPNWEQAGVKTPYGKYASQEVVEVFPSTLEEVKAKILEAKKKGQTISIVGAGMSQGRQILTSKKGQMLINTNKLSSVTINPSSKTAIVGSGASWQDIQNKANKHGLAIQVMQASNIFSIGGSLSVNCHGWDHHKGTVSNTVNWVKIIDVNGNEKCLYPRDELFAYVIGGYGGFGVIVEVELQLTDNLEMSESGEEVAPKDYISYFHNQVQKNKDTLMHLYRLCLDPDHLFETGIAVNYTKTAQKERVVSCLNDEPERGNRLDRILLHIVRRLGWFRKLGWQREKAYALQTHVSSRNAFMRPPINPIFNHSRLDTEWLQEYFVKGEDLEAFLAFLASVLKRNGVPVFNASVRYVKKDTHAKLGYASQGDRFAIVLFFNQSLLEREKEKTGAWVREVTQELIRIGGTYYMPYQPFATLEQFHSCYPAYPKVAEVKRRIDPTNLFSNGIFEDYILAEKRAPTRFSFFSLINNLWNNL